MDRYCGKRKFYISTLIIKQPQIRKSGKRYLHLTVAVSTDVTAVYLNYYYFYFYYNIMSRLDFHQVDDLFSLLVNFQLIINH